VLALLAIAVFVAALFFPSRRRMAAAVPRPASSAAA
jgi:hypothetical protein